MQKPFDSNWSRKMVNFNMSLKLTVAAFTFTFKGQVPHPSCMVTHSHCNSSLWLVACITSQHLHLVVVRVQVIRNISVRDLVRRTGLRWYCKQEMMQTWNHIVYTWVPHRQWLVPRRISTKWESMKFYLYVSSHTVAIGGLKSLTTPLIPEVSNVYVFIKSMQCSSRWNGFIIQAFTEIRIQRPQLVYCYY